MMLWSVTEHRNSLIRSEMCINELGPNCQAS